MIESSMRTASLLIVLLLAGAARSAPPESAAKRAFKEGATLFNRGDFVGAIEAFERAYRLDPHYLVLCNLARCFEQRSEMVKAASYYRRCLKEGAAASPKAAEVRANLVSVEARITSLRVKSSGVPGEVYVDGKERGRTPTTTLLDPGSHIVEVRWHAGSSRKGITTRGGEEQEIVFEPILTSPAATTRAVVPSRPAPRRRARLSSAWFWSGLGLTAALTAVTAILGAQTLQLRDEFEQTPTRSNYDRAVGRRLLTNVFLAGALTTASATTALFFFTDFSREQRAPRTAFGVRLGGTF